MILLWIVAFVLSIAAMCGALVMCVRMVEQNKQAAMLESQKTQRQGMENAYLIEREKLEFMKEQELARTVLLNQIERNKTPQIAPSIPPEQFVGKECNNG